MIRINYASGWLVEGQYIHIGTVMTTLGLAEYPVGKGTARSRLPPTQHATRKNVIVNELAHY